MFKSLLLIASAAVGGIYLTSDEGKKARKTLQKKKSEFEPIIKSLVEQATLVINESEEVDSDTIRANIEKLASQAKNTLLEIDVDKAADTISEAIKVASNKIRLAMNEAESAKVEAFNEGAK